MLNLHTFACSRGGMSLYLQLWSIALLEQLTTTRQHALAASSYSNKLSLMGNGGCGVIMRHV